MLENIEGYKKVVMTNNTSLGLEIMHYRAIIGAHQTLFGCHIFLEALLAGNVLTWDMIRFSVYYVEGPMAQEAF